MMVILYYLCVHIGWRLSTPSYPTQMTQKLMYPPTHFTHPSTNLSEPALCGGGAQDGGPGDALQERGRRPDGDRLRCVIEYIVLCIDDTRSIFFGWVQSPPSINSTDFHPPSTNYTHSERGGNVGGHQARAGGTGARAGPGAGRGWAGGAGAAEAAGLFSLGLDAPDHAHRPAPVCRDADAWAVPGAFWGRLVGLQAWEGASSMFILHTTYELTRPYTQIQPEVVSKVQGELAAHVAALEEKREVAEVVEDVVDFEDYMVGGICVAA